MSEQWKVLQEPSELAFRGNRTVDLKNPRGAKEQIRTRIGIDLKAEQVQSATLSDERKRSKAT
jgi:hypothetical protein